MSTVPATSFAVVEAPRQEAITTVEAPPVVRVASVPSDHVYVRHLGDPRAPDGVVRLPEPRRDGPRGAPWWPSPMLSADWVRANAHRFDLMHVHFGFDAVPARDLQDLVDALGTARRPLVVTVHDLRNPHHRDRRHHDDALDVLVPAATEVLTLTPGAAHEIACRFGRRSVVVPHPHVVPLDRSRHRDPAGNDGPFVVGVHLKSVRANMFTLDLVDVLADAVADLDRAVLRVDLHDVVGDPSHDAHVPKLVHGLEERAGSGRLELRVHPFFTDDELWRYLESLAVSVLPYRFGTHSGWLEACADLGTTVAAPRCGWYHHQQPVLSYDADESGFDALGLAQVIADAHGRRPVWQVGPTRRFGQRVGIAAAHRRLYERVVAA